MSNSRFPFIVRRITSEDSDHAVALHRILGLQVPAPSETAAEPVTDLLALVERQCLSVELLYGVYRENQLVTAALGLESPGRAAMVLNSAPADGDGSDSSATVAALRAVLAGADQRSLQLLEILVPPNDTMLTGAVKHAGFHYLTRLLYLRRLGSKPASVTRTPLDLEWVGYGPDRDPLFCEALELSYVQSLDCPELTGTRRTMDVLAGHRATGDHDPALWWVARRGGRPAGILLLSRISSGETLEIVYLGVAPPERRNGVGNALLSRAVEIVRHTGANGLALAVDCRNAPARRMYARWKFVQTIARDAWIATPGRSR